MPLFEKHNSWSLFSTFTTVYHNRDFSNICLILIFVIFSRVLGACFSCSYHKIFCTYIYLFSKNRPLADSFIESRCPYMDIYIYICPFSCHFFRGLSLALRSHDQIPASHWSTLLPYHMVE